MTSPLAIAKLGTSDICLLPAFANRHGLISGATGTGKTVTLQRLAEQFSSIGVPVFMADVKGDLSGIGAKGATSDKFAKRLQSIGVDDWQPVTNPVVFWDVMGTEGHPMRATISDMGPLLLGRLLELNETQEGVLQIIFRIADDNGLLLIDMKDLRSMTQHVGDNAADFKTQYGNISVASIGAIQRGLLTLEAQGGDKFFGEPVLNIDDLMQSFDGRGVVNILASNQLINSPKLYAACLIWLLAEIFERLPEVGDLEKPKLVFFFDEAHLLFNDAPSALVARVEQVVRLIRSKGVGVYFVTQNPLDVPDKVLSQLGNRVQHALRAFSPRDQKAVKAAAQTMRANPAFDAEAAITDLAVGEALVSLLDADGRPCMVDRAMVLPPGSRIGPLSTDERRYAMAHSLVAGVYEKVQDRESAYEKLQGNVTAAAPKVSSDGAVAEASTAPAAKSEGGWSEVLFGHTGPRGRQYEGLLQTVGKSVARTIGSQVGREIVRGIMGSILGGRRR